jgi:hypothetical protein
VRVHLGRRSAALLGALGIAVLGLLVVVAGRRLADSSPPKTARVATVATADQPSDPCTPGGPPHGPLNEARKHGSPTPAAASAPGIYLGVWQPGLPEDMAALSDFERQIGKHVAIVMLWNDSADDNGALDMKALCAIAARGSVPLITWTPSDWRDGADESPYQLDRIAAGDLDGYFTGWAEQLASYGRPVLLRWAHEMNGTWYIWGRRDNNSPAQYIAAWRHRHDLFVSAGATNVQWVWSPAVADDAESAFEPYYPGDAYVDWVALDGYNQGPQVWRWFGQIFSDSYNRITSLTTRPLMIAETASSEALPQQAALGDTKAKWITDAFTDAIPNRFPRIRAVVWFNENKQDVEKGGYDWRVQSSPTALHAFAAAVASSVYLSRWP